MRGPGETRKPGGELTPHLPRSYEDNFDAVNNLFVVVKPAEKSKIEVRPRCAGVGLTRWLLAPRADTPSTPRTTATRTPS